MRVARVLELPLIYIGGGNDDNISTTPLWAAPCAPALSRSETELGANGAASACSFARGATAPVLVSHCTRVLVSASSTFLVFP